MIAGIIFVCLLGGVLVWMLFLTKSEKDPAQEERLNDELLFDPLTGKKITLEEAERGVVVEDYEGPRVKSDQEIEENYSDDQKEIEYILRDFIKAGMDERESDDDDEAFNNILDKSEYARGLAKKSIHYLWEFTPGVFVGLVYVSYSYLLKEGPSHEYQTFAIIKDQDDIAAFAAMPDACVELIDDAVLIRLPRRALHVDFREFVEDVNARARAVR